MKRDEFNVRLEEIDEHDEDALEELGEAVRNDAREAPAAAAEAAGGTIPGRATKARQVLATIGEHAIDPLLDPVPEESVSHLVWRTELAVTAELALRERIAARLDPLLADLRPVPLPEGTEKLEEPPPARRVCDEVYGLLRRLLSTAETMEELEPNIDEFLNLPTDRKDAEIKRARDSLTWIELVEEGED